MMLDCGRFVEAALALAVAALLGPAALAAAAPDVPDEPEAAPRPTPGADEGGGAGVASSAPHGHAPLQAPRTLVVPFVTAPFPYDGLNPRTGATFLDAEDGGRRGHVSRDGTVYWEDETYSDPRVLVFLPAGFDVRKPAAMVVFFHGNGATLERDVMLRQQVPDQLAASGLNAVLVAPQMAVDARDSSAGRFWEPAAFSEFVAEAAEKAAELHGGAHVRRLFDRMPIILVGYSGGYLPAAWSLTVGGADDRVRGVVLLDALYSEQDKFAAWIEQRRPSAFFLSVYSDSSRPGNVELQDLLARDSVPFRTEPLHDFAVGKVTFLDAGSSVDHDGFLTQAFAPQPLAWILGRLKDVLHH